MRLPVNRPCSVVGLKRTVKNGNMLGLQVSRTLNRLGLFNVLDHSIDFWCVITQGSQREWDRPVDDLHHSPPCQLFVLHQSNVRLDPRRIAVHHERDCSGRSEHCCLSVSVSELTTRINALIPNFACGVSQVFGTRRINAIDGVAVHSHDSEHRLGIFFIPGEGAEVSSNAAGSQVSLTSQKRRERARDSTASVTVIRNTH